MARLDWRRAQVGREREAINSDYQPPRDRGQKSVVRGRTSRDQSPASPAERKRNPPARPKSLPNLISSADPTRPQRNLHPGR